MTAKRNGHFELCCAFASRPLSYGTRFGHISGVGSGGDRLAAQLGESDLAGWRLPPSTVLGSVHANATPHNACKHGRSHTGDWARLRTHSDPGGRAFGGSGTHTRPRVVVCFYEHTRKGLRASAARTRRGTPNKTRRSTEPRAHVPTF